MKKCAFILLLSIAFCSCKPKGLITQVPVSSRITINQRPVVISAPQDNAAVKALFTCDSNHQVIISDYAELHSKYMSLNSIITPTTDGGINFSLNANTNRSDTVVILNDTTIYQEVPVVTQVPVYIEKSYSNLIKVLIASGCLALAFVFYKILIFLKTKTF